MAIIGAVTLLFTLSSLGDLGKRELGNFACLFLLLDAALIGAAQRIEHYEISAYGTASALADELKLDSANALLKETLDEEGKANKTLSKLASGGMMSSGINRKAAERSDNEPVEESELNDGAEVDSPIVT